MELTNCSGQNLRGFIFINSDLPSVPDLLAITEGNFKNTSGKRSVKTDASMVLQGRDRGCVDVSKMLG